MDSETEEMVRQARLHGRLEAYARAMTECSRVEPAGFGLAQRYRNGPEVRTKIEILHLATLQDARKTP